MANWTHCICQMCWTKLYGDRIAVTVKNAPFETCCFCGEETKAGIYVRYDPKELKYCKCED